jgi:cation:H+ antiporter
LGFVIAAAAVLISGPFLATSADALADQTGLGEGFFGSFVLAIVTSLPELVASISAIRVGALNLAIANTLGSNATNVALILPLELALAPGTILAPGGPSCRRQQPPPCY